MKSTIGRIVLAIVILIFGVFHFMKGADMAAAVPSWIPGGVFWVYLTGAAHILAAIALIINKQASLAALLLAIMLLIFALTVHLPGAMEGVQNSTTQFLKDLAIAAGALYMSDYLSD
jgi:uncharacterized membrane protein